MKKFLLCLILALASSMSAQALKTAGHVKASLVPEVESMQPGQPLWVALRLEMQKDWHTYWKNAGESGAPTKISWRLPSGFSAEPIQWPYPHLIEVPPVVSYGYENEVWLLSRIDVPADLKAGQTVELAGHVDWLECSVECIPGEADVSIRLPVLNSPPQPNKNWVETFSEVRSQLPLTTTEWTWKGLINGNKVRLTFFPPAWFDGKLTSLRFYPESQGLIDYSAPQTFQLQNGAYHLDLVKSETSTAPLTSLSGVAVAEPGWRGPGSEKAIEIQTPLTIATFDTTPHSHLLVILLFAFVGGLILNLMPCVLPILSIKVLSFIKQGEVERSRVMVQSCLFTLGILFSFWVLAGLLLFLRAGGQQLGWGFQLQSPVFIFLLISLFTLLGLNLFGLFEMGTSLTRLGSYSSGSQRHAGAFLSGALTTIVATPCTAPFMGSALGFAITQPALISLLVFTFLGFGVATPYVLLSSFPKLAALVPKPGEWMTTLKQLMGFLMLGTVLWLMWVLTQQKGENLLIITMSALLVQSLGAWMLGRWGQMGKTSSARFLGSAGFLLLTGLSVVWGVKAIHGTPTLTSGPERGTGNGINWEPFSEELVNTYRKNGQRVFVDFTATWCLTCKVNERVALSSPVVTKKFKELNIHTLKADWTSRDPKITKALQEFGRSGVPLYVLYSSDPAAEPHLLPALLTPQIVLKTLEEIK